ncbi:uncharacterized protein LOC107610554 [Arachis ipaensis]|uniref:uncharacterized protein LOC107610554 n=1 Tax=Arachis ipaensis TaxID=130454 RepID=UPI0007AF611E|nr:uncharacterized protein LOC107610554 [Arachis ipaensis]XP_025669895.1 uncharacterized protein LOC112769618 [Arachis hypogaea]
MSGLVGETQSAFVKGRKIHDGALIVYETVHWLKRRNKEDMVLQKMGFGCRWRAWVMECVTTTSISVLINGSPSKSFKMERGLRQGDPLSPFLFVLVVDVLHRMVGQAVRNECISPLVVGRDGVKLSHLQFADDTILFCPPEDETMKNYKRLLSLWGCKEGTLPVKYLGVPLGANPKLVKTWKPIIDKVEEKLSLWKAKVLNKAGKLVLIKSVLNSLPVYYLSLYKMPKAVAEKLISLQRKFLWNKEDGRNGMALVRWELVQAPKKLGGLGVDDAMVRNFALLFKWWWRFAKEECLLWKKVVCSCNNLKPTELLSTQVLPTRGGPWKDICQLQLKDQHIRDKMITGLSMEIGDGRRTRFWEDIWLHCGSLKDRFPRLFSVSNLCGSTIGDCGFWDGLEWVWNFFWRRELFQWELDLLGQLHETLRPVLQEGMLSEDITSYSFTKTIWKGVECLDICVWPSMVHSGIDEGTLSKLDRRARRNEDRKQRLRCFCAVIWNIWMEMNKRIFQNKSKGVEKIINLPVLSYKEWEGALSSCC